MEYHVSTEPPPDDGRFCVRDPHPQPLIEKIEHDPPGTDLTALAVLASLVFLGAIIRLVLG
jgi:hypothetical protein